MRIILLWALLVLLVACSPQSNPPTDTTSRAGKGGSPGQTCSCDDYPFPKACESQCERAEVLVTSLSPDKRTAFVSIEHNGAVQNTSIPASKLPAAVPGSKFTTLLKKNPAAPLNSQIVRFVPLQKVKIPTPAH